MNNSFILSCPIALKFWGWNGSVLRRHLIINSLQGHIRVTYYSVLLLWGVDGVMAQSAEVNTFAVALSVYWDVVSKCCGILREMTQTLLRYLIINSQQWHWDVWCIVKIEHFYIKNGGNVASELIILFTIHIYKILAMSILVPVAAFNISAIASCQCSIVHVLLIFSGSKAWCICALIFPA